MQGMASGPASEAAAASGALMASADMFAGSGRVASGLLLMGAATMTMDVCSAVNSSPWTAESFGGDPAKMSALKFYVWNGVAVTSAFCVGSAVLARNVWPVIGAALANIYMVWLYYRAMGRARASGSTSWQAPGAP
jgi:hypothetical protein